MQFPICKFSISLLRCAVGLVVLLSGTACTPELDEWVVDLYSIGSTSSPAAADLNGDGVLDIVMGGATREFESMETGVVALDGSDGRVLWRVPARNQMVGSAIFQDVTGDGTPDVFIGGRSAQLLALDGVDGSIIWEFLPHRDGADYFNDTTLLNFFNSQWVPDVDGDGFRDLVTAYGGFVKAPAGDPNRPAGYLMVISGKRGEVRAKMMVPDGKETYLSPVVSDFGRGPEVVFGTGGEDIPGNLYRIPLSELLAENQDAARVILSGGKKGFIAPPILTDLDRDGTPEVAISTVDGRLVAISGADDSVLWTASAGTDLDTYTMPAPADFNGDGVTDLFASFGKGAWPNSELGIHIMVDGTDGSVLSQDTLGSFQYASPVIASFSGAGPGVMVVANHKDKMNDQGVRENRYTNALYVYDGGQGQPVQITELADGSNLGSTPLATDLDGDGYLDIVMAYMNDPSNFYSFRSLRIIRWETDIEVDETAWNGYMGAEGRSIYQAAAK